MRAYELRTRIGSLVALASLTFLTGCPSSSSETPGGEVKAPVSNGAPRKMSPGCVIPTVETVKSGAYTPLSRPLFLYTSKAALARPEVAAFLKYYLNEGQKFVTETGYVAADESAIENSRKTLAAALAETPEGQALKGEIIIDGSSTVFPISQAVAEEFQKTNPDVQVPVGESGTGGGFQKFGRGEIVICDASRPISDKEKKACADAGIEYIELTIALDGLTVVVNAENDWCDCLTVSELRKLWESGSTIKKWSELNPSWPDEEIKLYGADTKSGTFDYFTEEICKKKGNIRSDYEPSSDDNTLVKGVAGDKYSLGFFGLAYYIENQSKLKALGIDPESAAK